MIRACIYHWRTAIAFMLLSASFGLNAAPSISISILLSGESQLYYDAVDGISQKLDSAIGLDYDIKTMSDFNNEASAGEYASSDYIIAVGSKAARYIASSTKRTSASVLNILVSKRSYQAIYKDDENTSQQSVIYLDQPAERILLLAKLIVEDSNAKIGMLFGPTSSLEKFGYLSAAKKLSLQLIAKQENSSKASLDVIESLITTTDAYVALYDREVLNRKIAKWLLYMSNVHRKPVIAYSKSYVDAGAVAAVYTSPFDAGISAANWLIDNIKSDNKKIWKTYPQRFTVSINRKIATKLNLVIDDADDIATKMKLIEVVK